MTTSEIIEQSKKKIGFIRYVTHHNEKIETLLAGSTIHEHSVLGEIPSQRVVFPGIKQIEYWEISKLDREKRWVSYTPSNFLVVFSKKPSFNDVMQADEILILENDIIRYGETVWRDGIEMNIAEAADEKTIRGLLITINEEIG